MTCNCSPKKLRHKIQILREAISKDVVGGYTASWYTHLTIYAEIKPVSGSERYYAQRVESNVTHRICTRFCDITAKDRVLFKGREMDIESVVNIDERDKWLELLAVEGKEQ